MNVILFDSDVREHLLPITFTRPIAEIRVGALTLLEKWNALPNVIASCLPASYLSAKFPTKYDLSNLYINGTVIPSTLLYEQLTVLQPGELLMNNNSPIAFWGPQLDYTDLIPFMQSLKATEFLGEYQRLNKSWDVIKLLTNELTSDLTQRISLPNNTLLPDRVTAINPTNIHIAPTVKLAACIMNATNGTIVIDEGAEVMDGALLRGPIYIGKHSVVKMGAKIYGPVAIGPHCRLGGEVSDSILQAYSNKGHDGFLGHSYLGEWCNLGADTNTSNLKNNYEPVRMWNYVSKRFEHTNMQFLGLIMADHAKTAINTMLNTGTVVGVAANIYSEGFPRNFVPSFSRGGSKGLSTFPIKQALMMARAMMERRRILLTQEDEAIFAEIFNKTSCYRKFS